ncbi:MAG: CRISPR-associated protein Cas5 [bacterium]
MKAIKLEIKGNWAQFRKAETNNNPLSHDFITKTALIGMIGAVLGIERTEMKPLFPLLSEGLLYSVQVKNDVKKQSWGFTLRSVSHAWEKSPKQMEFIKQPHYTVMLALKSENCTDYFDRFVSFCKNRQAYFTPVLGLHNCPAEIEFVEEGEVIEKNGEFLTQGFLTANYQPKMDVLTQFRIGFDKIPTYQNDDFWNIPERFLSVVYPSGGATLKTEGPYYEFKDNTQWCMV